VKDGGRDVAVAAGAGGACGTPLFGCFYGEWTKRNTAGASGRAYRAEIPIVYPAGMRVARLALAALLTRFVVPLPHQRTCVGWTRHFVGAKLRLQYCAAHV